MRSGRNSKRAFVILNPAAGRGSGARRTDQLLKLLGKHLPGFEYAATEAPGQEAILADRAVRSGDFGLIVAVGGDGTWSNVADRVVASGADHVALGLLAAGTGNDFGRNFGPLGKDTEGDVRTLACGRVRTVDVGRILTRGRPLGPEVHVPQAGEGRHFLNLVGFGFDVAVIEDAARARYLRGAVLYKVTAAKNLLSFPGVEVALASDGGVLDGSHLMLTVSNGRFFGGGFPIAPAAEVEDGLLDACAIRDTTPLGRAKLFRMAEKGRHVRSRHVRVHQSRRFTVRAEQPPKYEVDGELWQADGPDVVIEVVRGALRIVVPA